MAKYMLGCIEKYIGGRDLEDIFLETKVFDKEIVEEYLNRSHYVRSLRAILVLTDTIDQQNREAFWGAQNKIKHKDLLLLSQRLYDNKTAKQPMPCDKMFNLCREKLKLLDVNILDFSKDCNRTSFLS